MATPGVKVTSTEEKRSVLFAMWRWDMWMAGHGSYEEIHRKVEHGELIPGECPKRECDCRWIHDPEAK